MARNFRPMSYSASSRSSTTSSSSTSTSSRSISYSKDYAEILQLLDVLTNHKDVQTTDPRVNGKINQLHSLYVTLSVSEQGEIQKYLKNQSCNQSLPLSPGTVGAYLCGCFLKSSDYGNIEPGCTAVCASNPLVDPKPCAETVVWWTTRENGDPTYKLLQMGNSTCRIYVDRGFPKISSEKQQEFLSATGCQSVSMYDSVTNQPISNSTQMTYTRPNENIQPPTIQPPPQVKPPVIKPYPQETITQVEQKATSSWWIWLIGFFLLFIVIGIIIFLYMAE